jgi:hypothetical protein
MRAVLVVIGLFALTWSSPARGEEQYAVQWRLRTTSVWPPVLVDGKVILKSGDVLAAHAIDSGRLVWTQKLANLRYGEGVVSGGGTTICVLNDEGLLLLGASDGQVLAKKTIVGPTSVLYAGGSVYVTGARTLYRFDARGRLLQQARGFSGELRGADGDYAAIFTHRTDTGPKQSPKRLTVVNLKTGKQAYEFKLLPTGSHRVVKVVDGRVVFIDYSQRTPSGENPNKLYYTEADYRLSRKIKDVSLADKYTAAAADTFWIAADSAGVVFLGNHGAPGEPSTLTAYDPRQAKTLWSRRGTVVAMGLLLHRGRLWTGTVTQAGVAQVVAYGADNGSTLFTHALDAPGTGSPVALDDRVLVRSRDSITCLGPRPAPASVPVTQPVGGQPIAKPGWRMFRDRVAGYLVQTPSTWAYNKASMRNLGGLRFIIPFSRVGVIAGRPSTIGMVHLLTWEAAGRDADGLWRSVYAQRQQLNPDVRVTKVERVAKVGGTAGSGVLASYTFYKGGYPMQLRSLCVVDHGVAFELRGWASAYSPQEVWREVEGIFASFRPQRF